jgi:hypothetical protein
MLSGEPANANFIVFGLDKNKKDKQRMLLNKNEKNPH